jgi:crotonobetaine/carnitine-CoA ligase
LHALPEIAEAAAVPVPDETRGEEVKACIVLQPGLGRDAVTPDRILAHCTAELARFKVPRYIAYCDDLPKTASGKIAKHLLTNVPDPVAGCFDRVEGRWR